MFRDFLLCMVSHGFNEMVVEVLVCVICIELWVGVLQITNDGV